MAKLRGIFGRKPSPVVYGALAALLFTVVSTPAVISASGTARQLPIYCVQRDQKLVSISFDAAWGDVILRQWLKLSMGKLLL